MLLPAVANPHMQHHTSAHLEPTLDCGRDGEGDHLQLAAIIPHRLHLHHLAGGAEQVGEVDRCGGLWAEAQPHTARLTGPLWAA